MKTKTVYKVLRRSGGRLLSSNIAVPGWETEYQPGQPTYPPPLSYLYAFDSLAGARQFARAMNARVIKSLPGVEYEVWQAEAEVVDQKPRRIHWPDTPPILRAFWANQDFPLRAENYPSAPPGTVWCRFVTIQFKLKE